MIAWLGGGFALLILLIRFTGLFQWAEWMLGDLFMRLNQPPGVVSNRITLVTIDETDLQNLGEFPLSDRILFQALTKLNTAQPKLIGLSFYRSFSLDTRDRDWQEFSKAIPSLIASEKVMGYEIIPPKSASAIPQSIGFSDRLLDGDGKIRRVLLAKNNPQNNQLSLSFPLKLAVNYLNLDEQAIANSITNDGFDLKQARIDFFKSDDAGYIRANDDGYQIPINYLGTKKQFTAYSLSQLLAGEVPADKIRDRLVLIGSTADSFSKQYQTSYSNQWGDAPKQMAGIVIDANITSQLLSIALDDRSTLKSLPESLEWLWIIFWGLWGAAIGWWLQSILLIVPGGVVSIIILLGITYLAFLHGWILPLFPSLLVLALASKTFPLVAAHQLRKIRLRHTVKQIIQEAETKPAAVEVAIENLKQEESDDNRVYIARLVREMTQESKSKMRSPKQLWKKKLQVGLVE